MSRKREYRQMARKKHNPFREQADMVDLPTPGDSPSFADLLAQWENEYLSFDEACRVANCQPTCVRRACRLNDVRCIPIGGGSDDWLIHRSEIGYLRNIGARAKNHDRRRRLRKAAHERGDYRDELIIRIVPRERQEGEQ